MRLYLEDAPAGYSVVRNEFHYSRRVSPVQTFATCRKEAHLWLLGRTSGRPDQYGSPEHSLSALISIDDSLIIGTYQIDVSEE